MSEPEVAGQLASAPTEALHRSLGMTDEEYDTVVRTLGREPNRTELAMYSVMWSEHCSYKSSKIHLRQLPTEGPQVLVGPGQDAGAVDVGEGLAAVFKIESHSHPSAIEPFQGAATGVGGIIRDILSMGARPVALLDPLRFGPLTEPRNRWLLSGVVAGIGQYGNSIGVPTVGGEVQFADAHSANPAINVMCVGLAPADRLVQGKATGEGNLMVLIGATTGRDGIGGVSVLASATIEDGAEENRPSVQIGDPFTEKLLVEACLELIEQGLLVGLQDLGGAGLTCATSETTASAGTGCKIDLNAVPLREPGLEPFEILTSESQERMLAIVEPGNREAVLEICTRWGLLATVIGTVTDSGHVVVYHDGELVVHVPARSLADEGPVYTRPIEPMPDPPAGTDPRSRDMDIRTTFFRLLSAPNIASKRWIYEQYDHLVQGGTIRGSEGTDAALIRLPGSDKAMAVSTDGKGRFGALDPYLGAAHAVAESARNVACSGAKPLAITNCMNFGNPERPQVMWQFAEAIRGMSDACLAFDTPVTGGNVSFYNESGDSAVWPTPVIGMLGLIQDYHRAVPSGFPRGDLSIYLLGETLPEFGGSELAEVVLGEVAGTPPKLDLEAEAALLQLLQDAAAEGLLTSAHDCAEGGAAIAVAEAAIANGVGATVELPGEDLLTAMFSESASRVIVSIDPLNAGTFEKLCADHGVPAAKIGETGGPAVAFVGGLGATLVEIRAAYELALPNLLG